MKVAVKLNNIRISPRKVRQVVDLVRGKKALDAQAMLSFTVNKPAKHVLKLLNSAIASAKKDFHLDENNLVISRISVEEGVKLKRWHPMSRGRAYPIIKRSSHIYLTLSNGDNNKKEEIAKPVVKPAIKKEVKPKKAKNNT
jgi:large subunit ribosomal protein L22